MYPLPLSATLEERLEAWRNAPGRGWEPADYVAWNLQTCGDVIPNHNKCVSFSFFVFWSFYCVRRRFTDASFLYVYISVVSGISAEPTLVMIVQP